MVETQNIQMFMVENEKNVLVSLFKGYLQL